MTEKEIREAIKLEHEAMKESIWPRERMEHAEKLAELNEQLDRMRKEKMNEEDMKRIADDRIVNFLSRCVSYDDCGNMSIWFQSYNEWLIKTTSLSGETHEGQDSSEDEDTPTGNPVDNVPDLLDRMRDE